LAGTKGSQGDVGRRSITQEEFKTKFSVVLDKIEQLPAVMSITQLLQQTSAQPTNSMVFLDGKASEGEDDISITKKLTITTPTAPVSLSALRLIELTERSSAVLKSQEADYLILSDPVISIFRTFGLLNRMRVTASLSVVDQDEFSTSVVRHVQESSSQMVIIPWPTGSPGTDAVDDGITSVNKTSGSSPFDYIFRAPGTDYHPSSVYSHYIRRVFADAPADVALIINRCLPTDAVILNQHVFLPFFGGPDDRLALSFVVQLCMHPSVTATVVRMHKEEGLSPVSSIEEEKSKTFIASPPSQYNVRISNLENKSCAINLVDRLSSPTLFTGFKIHGHDWNRTQRITSHGLVTRPVVHLRIHLKCS
jgi:hypothetical protein